MSINNLNSERISTREDYKKAKYDALEVNKSEEKKVQEQDENQAVDRKKGRVRIRLIPIWLRLILLAVFIFVSLMIGAVVGYSGLGGGKVSDVFKVSTWTYIRDLVEKK
ncbi:DNA-directed RNA polymerase subunit beta [Bacillus sp. BRMEA1]|uniref:DNA-directed RNA polymerase subunit beta n=1 Tax=Neobacillus endophyticus TaxID=2738405 RepID=UPI0015664A55|nr:DNA-directed RNA polymerase subunit beta [Neobacillus endophyticus]NRD77149.1 DNA-directed RNA polymerase subunit beta [Neobacillus endophyticus]